MGILSSASPIPLAVSGSGLVYVAQQDSIPTRRLLLDFKEHQTTI
jgi:hypothetical protein